MMAAVTFLAFLFCSYLISFTFTNCANYVCWSEQSHPENSKEETISITPWPDVSSNVLMRAGRYDEITNEGELKSLARNGLPAERTEIILIPFGKFEDLTTIRRELKEGGLRPATLGELLWIGVMHPELQIQFPIVAMGSSYKGKFRDRESIYACLGAHPHLRPLLWFQKTTYHRRLDGCIVENFRYYFRIAAVHINPKLEN